MGVNLRILSVESVGIARVREFQVGNKVSGMRVQVIQERWRCTFEDEVSKVESADPGVKMVLRSSVDIRTSSKEK